MQRYFEPILLYVLQPRCTTRKAGKRCSPLRLLPDRLEDLTIAAIVYLLVKLSLVTAIMITYVYAKVFKEIISFMRRWLPIFSKARQNKAPKKYITKYRLPLSSGNKPKHIPYEDVSDNDRIDNTASLLSCDKPHKEQKVTFSCIEEKSHSATKKICPKNADSLQSDTLIGKRNYSTAKVDSGYSSDVTCGECVHVCKKSCISKSSMAPSKPIIKGKSIFSSHNLTFRDFYCREIKTESDAQNQSTLNSEYEISKMKSDGEYRWPSIIENFFRDGVNTNAAENFVQKTHSSDSVVENPGISNYVAHPEKIGNESVQDLENPHEDLSFKEASNDIAVSDVIMNDDLPRLKDEKPEEVLPILGVKIQDASESEDLKSEGSIRLFREEPI